MIDEGYIKFELDWVDGPPPPACYTEPLSKWRRPLYAAGLIGHYDELDVGYGNLSMRAAPPAHFVISGTQTGHLADTGPEHYAAVTGYDLEKNTVQCRGPLRASSESMTHAALYRLSTEIGAVVHVHSQKLWESLLNRLPTTAASVAYGTPDMAREFARLYCDTDFRHLGVAVMAGHEEGVLAVGRDLEEASQRILELHSNLDEG